MIRATKAAQSFPSPQTKRMMGQPASGQTMNAPRAVRAQEHARDNMSDVDYSAALEAAKAAPY
jgi:hypothetical protein